MQSRDVIGAFAKQYPHESVRLVIFAICFIWQSIPTIIGGMIFLSLSYIKNIKSLWIFLIGILIVLIGLSIESVHQGFFSLSYELKKGLTLNYFFWQKAFNNELSSAFLLQFKQGLSFILSLPIFLVSLLLLVELIPTNVHKKNMSSLHHGKNLNVKEVISDKKLSVLLNNLNDKADGTVLGVSLRNGEPAILSDHHLNHVLCVLGTTGGGKTITLRRFYQRAIIQGYPLIVIDGKPTDENVTWLQNLAKQYNRPFYGFNCGDYHHYDSLSNGGYTELKDKIISLKDQWESDYYRSIAEDYLQTTLEVLLKSGKPFDLATIVRCLNFSELVTLVRSTKNQYLKERVESLEEYDRKDITGLQAHLNLLIHSELGDYFKIDETSFELNNVIKQNAVVYFALPALRFPSFSKVLGKLVINDLKAVIDRETGDKRVFMIFDEFSVFAGEQVLNLVNMGRGKGVHAVFGTQGLADLDKVDVAFKNQLLNCVNTLICHRLNDHDSAETLATWIGTKDTFNITAQLNVHASDANLGTVKQTKEFIVHPDEIKQELGTGEAFLISKVYGFKQDKIKVKYC